MQSMGLSKFELARPAIKFSIIIALICYAISMFIQPISAKNFRDMQLRLKNDYVALLVQDGVFSTPVDGLMVFVRERDSAGILHGIMVHDNREEGKSITMMAESGKLVETPQGPRFLLKNGNRQELDKGRLSLLNFESYTLDISLYNSQMGGRYRSIQEMFLPELLANDKNASEMENNKRRAEAHQRIIWPSYSITLTLFSLAVLFSGQFNRRGQWQRVTMAAVVSGVILFAAV